MLQLMRGAGVSGLAAMPRAMPFYSGRLVRPLLHESRTNLEAFLRGQEIGWIEDDSNVDERFDRNYLRRRVLPVLRERWPAAARVVSRSAAHLGEARDLLEV
ncbi:MAG: ATP-binding protein, partial [bacterium]